MKFSTLALTTVAAAVGVADAKGTHMSSEMIQTKLNRSANTRGLIEKIRKLQNDGDDDDANAEFELTGDYSIRFNSCVSMEIEMDDNTSQKYDGATAVQEVLIVDLVSSDSSKPVQEVAMDIGTFVSSIGTMVYEQVESYCTVCQDIAESCEDGTSSSWLSQSKSSSAVSDEGTTIEYVDCDTCALYNCYAENDDDEDDKDQVDMESSFSYLTELSECQAFSFSYTNAEYADDGEGYQQQQEQEDDEQQGQGLYISYMCNQYGTGIDLGFFLDNECTIYTAEESVSDSISENSMAGKYLMASKSLIEGIFLNSFSCNSIEFAAPYSANDENDNSGYSFQNYGNNANSEQSTLQANEYCQAVLEGENTIAIGTCDTSSSTYGSGNSWYSANAGESDAEDGDDDDAATEGDALCEAIAAMQSNYAEAYVNGEEGAEGLFDFSYYGNQNSYGDEENDGNNQQQSTGHNYRTFGAYNEEHRVAANQRSLGSVLLYVGMAVVAVAGAAYFFVYKKKETDEAKKQSLILEGEVGDYKPEGEIA